MLISSIIRFLTDKNPDTAYGFKLLAAFLISKVISSTVMFQEWTNSCFSGAQSTEAMKHVVVRKIQRLTPSTNKKYDNGQITNLVNDCHRIWGALTQIDAVLINPPMLIIKFFMLY